MAQIQDEVFCLAFGFEAAFTDAMASYPAVNLPDVAVETLGEDFGDFHGFRPVVGMFVPCVSQMRVKIPARPNPASKAKVPITIDAELRLAAGTASAIWNISTPLKAK
jgi:hypothetical protein